MRQAEEAGLEPMYAEGDSRTPWVRPSPCWFVGDDPFVYHPIQPAADLKRHRRKYAQGDLEEDAFYFTGPDDRLHLRVQNLMLFAQIAEGIDDETWTWHLQRGDYERWFRDAIGDDEIADLAAELADVDDAKGDPATDHPGHRGEVHASRRGREVASLGAARTRW